MQSEDAIRDQLAQNLDLIEPNLRFLEKEYKLPNSLGSKGFVDILATDVFGNYVTGKRIDESAYDKFVKDNRHSLISKPVDICAGFFDHEILRHFNLNFKNKLTTVNQAEEKQSKYFFIDDDNVLHTDDRPVRSIMAWVQQNLVFCWNIIQLYDANAFHL